MPTKSVVRCCADSAASGEEGPYTVAMSPPVEIELFSSSMFAADTPPTLQPAAV